jgi:tetratricopeptide (TPR) repeat protein
MNEYRQLEQEDLNEDAFVNGMMNAWEAFNRNRGLVIGVVIVLVAAVIGGTAWMRSQGNKEAASQVLLNRAIAHIEAGDFTAAGEWLERVEGEAAGSEAAIDASYFQGMIALRQDKLVEAREMFDHYLHARSRGDFMEAAALCGLAVCDEREEKWEDAARHWTRAGLMQEGNFRASANLLNAALCWERAGKPDEGLRLIDRLLENYPTAPEKTRAEVARERMLRMQ